ncbi:MAG: PHP domain-containing protein, partial [Candidatus Eremiobacteraeota bacterium]|nr:PHP domain-containing protein [Candidatus Eremiobacteraeota bacterium]
MKNYAELHCWSNFTFLEGGSHPEELVQRGAELGLAALALTDRDGFYGMVRFSKHAKALQFPAICGAELTFEDAEESHRRPRLVLLAENETGYANLAALISASQLRGSKADARLQIGDLHAHAKGLIALSSSRHGLAECALLRDDFASAKSAAVALKEIFGDRFYLELQHHLRPGDSVLLQKQLELSKALAIPYVATNGVVYAHKQDARLADVLVCVKHTVTLAQAREQLLLRPNAEFFLKAPALMQRLFRPYPQAIRNTLAIAERCQFRLDRLTGQFPQFPIPTGETSRQTYLRKLVYEGAASRYPTPFESQVERQLE